MSAEDWKTVRHALLSWAAYAKDTESAGALAALERLEAEDEQQTERLAELTIRLLDHQKQGETLPDTLDRLLREWHSGVRAEAGATAMREALEAVKRFGEGLPDYVLDSVDAALATDAGAALLEARRRWEALGHENRVKTAKAEERAEKAEAERDQTATLAHTIGEQAKALLAERDALRAEVERQATHTRQRQEQIARLQETVERLTAQRDELEQNTSILDACRDAIAQARREERERCAKEAQAVCGCYDNGCRIAAAILALGEGT